MGMFVKLRAVIELTDFYAGPDASPDIVIPLPPITLANKILTIDKLTDTTYCELYFADKIFHKI
jgi:hypothetical protein